MSFHALIRQAFMEMPPVTREHCDKTFFAT